LALPLLPTTPSTASAELASCAARSRAARSRKAARRAARRSFAASSRRRSSRRAAAASARSTARAQVKGPLRRERKVAGATNRTDKGRQGDTRLSAHRKDSTGEMIGWFRAYFMRKMESAPTFGGRPRSPARRQPSSRREIEAARERRGERRLSSSLRAAGAAP